MAKRQFTSKARPGRIRPRRGGTPIDRAHLGAATTQVTGGALETVSTLERHIEASVSAVPDDWHRTIERERTRMVCASAVLRSVVLACSSTYLVEAESGDGCSCGGLSPPQVEETVSLARALIEDSIARLDSIYLEPLVRQGRAAASRRTRA